MQKMRIKFNQFTDHLAAVLDYLALPIIIAWVVITLAQLTACSQRQAPVRAEPTQETMEEVSGLRPTCVPPPKTYEGVFFLFAASCAYVGTDGPANCVYLGELDVGTQWACGIGMYQDACDKPWRVTVPPRCNTWSDQFEVLMQKLQAENDNGHN